MSEERTRRHQKVQYIASYESLLEGGVSSLSCMNCRSLGVHSSRKEGMFISMRLPSAPHTNLSGTAAAESSSSLKILKPKL